MFSPEQIRDMCVPIGSTIREAMRAIDHASVGAAFLIEADGCFAGLVTDGDLRRALLRGQGLDAPVSAVGRPVTVTARVTDPPEKVTALFREEVRLIPLLDDAGKVVSAAAFDQRIALPVAAPTVGERELQYVTECVVSGWISSTGPFVRRFEDLFATFCGTKHAIATSNGTTALHLSMLALGLSAGDEVIVPSLTFIATANAVAYVGATPVFVDCDPVTWTIDPATVEAAVTPRTKAIIPVHLYGHPADMEALLAVAKRHGLALVEDAAEAHGALCRGKPVGGIGDMGIFSFYGNKIVTTGEGGMIVTNDDTAAERMRLLRDHGMSHERRYWHTVLGYNYRLTSLQAALGVAQMERIDDIIAAKLRIAQQYRAGLSGIPGITLPACAPWARNVYWLYSILVDAGRYGRTRDELMALLKERDIDTRPFFPPVHRQPIYENGQHLPVSEQLADTGMSLPSSAHLRPEHIERVCREIKRLQCP
jgi:perosamine synthetase